MRQNKNGKGNETDSFNSRTHAGCDSGQITSSPCFAVSIHAPTRGATHSSVALIPFLVSFNSRTHAGCDLDNPILSKVIITVSIHAPTRGATYIAIIYLIYIVKFQFTHPRGVRPTCGLFLCKVEYTVSIHAPTRGATKIKMIKR